MKEHITNEVEYCVRASQAAVQYGPGAMVDFKDQTLMTAAPSRWRQQTRIIHDKRLQERLKVSYFGVPQNKRDESTGERHGISYVRFPEWYFCPSCGDFKPLSEWKKAFEECPARSKYEQNDTHMLKYIRCFNPKCQRRPLVASRFVMTCSDGHIDNFPWDAYVHYSNGVEPHLNPSFKIDVGSRSDSLEGIKIKCSCGKSATMSRILDPRKLESLKNDVANQFGQEKALKAFGCTGRHPWKYENQYSALRCSKQMHVVIRGSSAVYFPVSISSIVIPSFEDIIEANVRDRDLFSEFEEKLASLKIYAPSDSELEKLVEEKRKYFINVGVPEAVITNEMIMKGIDADIEEKNKTRISEIENLINEYKDSIAKDITNISEEQVEKVLRDFIKNNSNQKKNEYSSTDYDFEYKEAEFKALNGEDKKFGFTDGFSREQIPIEEYNRELIPAVKSVSLITSLREVQALVGFSRQFPISFTDELYEKDENYGTSNGVPKLVKINEGKSWFPGYEIKGEGIFIELDAEKISEWENQGIIKARTSLLNKSYVRSFTGKARPDRHIKPGFVLVHTLSHLLLNQMSFDCGYNVASLKERVYYGSNSDGVKRAGILIYTSSGDSEGSLGGLVRLGRPDVFPKIFDKALKSARFCSNDPVCNCSTGQGKESLNLAACHSCVLLPETCCEEFNIFLDRGMLIGTFDEDGDFGFFDSKYAKVEINNSTPEDTSQEAEEESKDEFLTRYQRGPSLGSYSFKEIFTEEIEAESKEDMDFFAAVLKLIEENEEEYIGIEKPYIDCKLFIGNKKYDNVILWPQSGIAYFLSENANQIDEANKTNKKFKCINYTANIADLLSELK